MLTQDQERGHMHRHTPGHPPLLQQNTAQLLKAQLDFLSTLLLLLLLLLPSFMKAGSLVNKCGGRLFLHSCFHILGLAASCRALLSSQRCLTVGRKVQVRREELSLSSQAYEHTDAGRHPCIIPFCRSMSDPMVHKHVRACGT